MTPHSNSSQAMASESQNQTTGSEGGSSTSRSLLAGLRENDSQAWERLIRLYTPLVCYWCRRLNLRDQDMADVVQEIFKAVAQNLQRFRKVHPNDSFRGWLRTITRSKAMDHYRRLAKQPQLVGESIVENLATDFPPPVDDDPNEEEEAHQALFHRALELIRQEFHERTWQAFWRVVVDDQSPADVAAELDMRPGTVRVAKCRVLQRLRRELGELLD